MTEAQCVDVVVDVAASRLESAFTYLTGAIDPDLGARVRVPFGERSVGGWVVSRPRAATDPAALRAITSVDASAAPLDPDVVDLADWLHRRYSCGYREAILAIAARDISRQSGATFSFSVPPSADDAPGQTLHRRFGDRRFTAVAARRALQSAGRRIALAGVLREMERLCRSGVVTKSSGRHKKPVTARRTVTVRLIQGAAPKGDAQRRLAAALADQSAGLPVPEAARRASTTSAVVRRAVAAGVLAEMLPPGTVRSPQPPQFEPTADQAAAIAAIADAARAGGSTVLLHGVTGSGKTFVYARSIDRIRAAGGRAIVLVPEISLTPQTAGRFEELYGASVGVLHSGLSEGDRSRVWEDAKSGTIDVVVGARSAVFAPLPDLRIIVIDEEHEPSYKQDVAPRYDTAAVARERMRRSGGVVVLGSATPSLETYWEARQGAIGYVRLNERATRAPMPPVEIVDMTVERNPHRRGPLGPALVAAMEHALARGEKTLLFVNRRGYAGLLLCRSCGFAPKCRRCAISLVVHLADGSMRCHVCGAAYRIAEKCPKCDSPDLKPFGFGTQRVEEEVKALFPDARIVRMDSDTTSTRGAHGALLAEFGGHADVLIGTQMIAKGLDFPTVTVVGVVTADIDLNRPDFRAAERTFALLTQVAGRAGRAAPGARVVVQTYAPDHYAIRLASQHDYEGFAERELGLRRELRYPPFGRLAYLSLAGADASAVSRSSIDVAEAVRPEFPAVEVLGPAPEPLAKARGEYRMRVALKADAESSILDACAWAKAVKLARGVRLVAIIDPR